MRKFLLGLIIWGTFGYVLATKGIFINIWQFWALLALVIADSINSEN